MTDIDKLYGPNGEPNKGMKITEAADRAEIWWNTSGRYKMPDYGKPPEQCETASAILRGLEWVYLSKRDRLSLVKTWYKKSVFACWRGMIMASRPLTISFEHSPTAYEAAQSDAVVCGIMGPYGS